MSLSPALGGSRKATSIPVVAGTAGAVAIGVAIGAGGIWSALGLAVALMMLLGGTLAAASQRVFRPIYVEVPALLLLIANLSLRARNAGDLAENPLDTAGLIKLAGTMLALAIGTVALLTPRKDIAPHVAPLPLVLYLAYVLVAALGVLASQMPFLTGYRVMGVLAPIVVLFGALRGVGREALPRLERVLLRWGQMVLLFGWAAVFVAPGIALEEVQSPIPFRIDIPTLGITANSFGTIGALVVVWYLARLFERDREPVGRRSAAFWIVVGLASIIGAQYRTGYVALALALSLVLVLRARKTMMLTGVVAVVALGIWGPAVADQLQPYVLRGQTPQEAAELSGRLEWWSLAGPVWESSPYVGQGLQTATRFILADAGYDETSTIHSTWVEALIGTGLFGLTCLAMSLSAALYRAFRVAVTPSGRVVPLVLLVIIATRSVTGASIEDGGYQLMVFLTIAAGLVPLSRPSARRMAPIGTISH